MSRRVDVLVLGAGPAGSAAAARIAAAGARTLLVERSAFPRDKVCGEFVSAEGCRVLARLGVLDDLRRAGARPMRACRLTDPRGVGLDVGLPEIAGVGRDGLGVSRARLDLRLLELAAASGAEVRQRVAAREPLLEDGRVTGFRLRPVRGRAEETVHASLVVAADGRRSRLARLLHPELCDPRRTGPRSWFGLKTHLAADPRRLAGRVELHLFEDGYAGLAGVEDRRINLCLLTRVSALGACGGSPDQLFDQRVRGNPALRRVLEGADRCGPWNSVGPLRFGARRPAAAGAMFVGDAAGTVDPYSGEGIAHALAAAEIAVPFALAAAERGGLDEQRQAAYSVAWRRRFGGVTRRIRLVGSLFDHPRIGEPALRLLAGVGRRWAPRLVAATRSGRGSG